MLGPWNVICGEYRAQALHIVRDGHHLQLDSPQPRPPPHWLRDITDPVAHGILVKDETGPMIGEAALHQRPRPLRRPLNATLAFSM